MKFAKIMNVSFLMFVLLAVLSSSACVDATIVPNPESSSDSDSDSDSEDVGSGDDSCGCAMPGFAAPQSTGILSALLAI